MFTGSMFRSRSVVAFVAALTLTLARAALAQEDQAAEKPPTLAEAKAAFAKADRELNQAWSAAKAAVTGSTLTDLTQSQRGWLEFRNENAQRESEQSGEKDAKRSATWHSVAADLTESRTEWLRGRALAAKEPLETLTGRWVDSYGGAMRIVHQPGPTNEWGAIGVGRLLFDIEVVRGPTYHTGGVAGGATWNDRIGWWSDKGYPEKTDESNLAFIDRDRCVEVIGANTTQYHGARAYFDGIYCKAGPLDEKEQAEVTKNAESGEIGEQKEGGG